MTKNSEMDSIRDEALNHCFKNYMEKESKRVSFGVLKSPQCQHKFENESSAADIDLYKIFKAINRKRRKSQTAKITRNIQSPESIAPEPVIKSEPNTLNPCGEEELDEGCKRNNQQPESLECEFHLMEANYSAAPQAKRALESPDSAIQIQQSAPSKTAAAYSDTLMPMDQLGDGQEIDPFMPSADGVR